MIRKLISCLLVTIFLLASTSAIAADSIALSLKSNGTDIKGESTQTTLGRGDTIECLSYEQNVATAREAGSGMATGRRQYEPLKITKRIDKSSPLLMKALTNNEIIEGTFKFFRPNPTGDGTTQQYYTVTIKKGRVAAIKQVQPADAAKNVAATEEVTFVFQEISWTYTNGGITHTDTTAGAR